MTLLKKNLDYVRAEKVTAEVEKELELGLALLNKIREPLITFFGSHFPGEDDPWYQHARETARELAEQGYGLITGGGPGIMEAGNRGAKESGMPSIGFKEILIKGEEAHNQYFTHWLGLKYLFVRRYLLAIKSQALIFYPGGYGTLNELFEYVTLVQTGLTDKVPIICVGREYWAGLFDWLKTDPLQKGYVSEEHLKLIDVVDTEAEVLRLIKK